jgi:hypothetical protein
MNTDEIELRTMELADGGELSPQELLKLDDNLQAIADRVKEVREKLKPLFIQYIKEHGPIVNGTVRFFIGRERETKCLDVQKTVEAVLAVNGSISDIANCLSTQPFKNATTSRFIGPAAVDLFETKDKVKLKADGTRDRQQLIKLDTRFVDVKPTG